MTGERVVEPPQEFIEVLRDRLNVTKLAIPANLWKPSGNRQGGWIKAARRDQIPGKRLARCRVENPDDLSRLWIPGIVRVQQSGEIAVHIGESGHGRGPGRGIAN